MENVPYFPQRKIVNEDDGRKCLVDTFFVSSLNMSVCSAHA